MISILILTKNEALNIERCLDMVFRQEVKGEYEVVVVDSGSSDCTLEIAQRYPVRGYSIAPEEFHHARTRNFAASLAQGEFLVYLAADALPATTDWLHWLISNFSDPDVAGVYGRHLPKEGSTFERQ